MGNSSFFKIDINFTDADMKELFEPFDPLRMSEEEFSNDVTPSGTYDPIDFSYIESIKDLFLGDLIDHYFRARIHDVDKIQDEGPVILGCNHSGTAFPHDALMLDALLWRHSDFRKDRKCRSVYSPKLAKEWWMRPFGLDDFWRRGGAVDMTFDNFDRLLEQEERVIYYPEGVPGIGKGFSRRYQLQHFFSSFVVLAARHNAPFYPIICVNAEWVNPTSITVGWVDRIFDKLLGVPFFPIPAAFIAFIFPFFFYLAFPGNMKFFVLDPVDIRSWLEEEGCTNFQKPDRIATQRVANRVREYMQKELDEAVLNHGKKPYHWTSLKRRMKQIKKRDGNWIKATPFGWPFAFLEHERNMNRPPAKNKLHAKLRDWDIWLYFVPLGWFLIGLTRKFRKPPYGYRGLSEREKKIKTGKYFWSLKQNPMPPRNERFS